MYLPELNLYNIKKRVNDRFGGINKKSIDSENEFSDTMNICSDSYPALSSAPSVYELDSIDTGYGNNPLFFRNRKVGCIADFREDTPEICKLIYGGDALCTFEFRSGGGKANMLNFNGKTVIAKGDTAYEFDPMYTNPLLALSKIGCDINISATHTSPEFNEPTLCLSLVYEDMSEIRNIIQGTGDFPDDAVTDDLFIKNLECYRLIFKSEDEYTEDVWQPVVSFRLKLELGDGYRNFKEGDYIRLKDLEYWNWAIRYFKELDRFVRIDAVDSNKCYITEAIPVFEDYNMILLRMEYPSGEIHGYGVPVVNNPGNKLCLLGGNISACMPEIDMMCQGANRIWACNSEKREIYASELGSSRNWSVFEGLSSDSFCVSVGSPGDFTACCSFRGEPIFFKENEMIVITGSRPSSFTLNSRSLHGVPRHSPNGVCVCDDAMYFMAYDGVYLYDGSRVVCISGSLGDEMRGIRDSVLCVCENKLYVCGKRDDENICYVYDTAREIWHRRSSYRIIGFLTYPDTALQVVHDGSFSTLYTTTENIPVDYELNGARLADQIWFWESTDISFGTADKKYVRRISVDAECDGISELFISYDGGKFIRIGRLTPHRRGGRKFSVFPRRCDSFRLRMEGKGKMKLYGITKETEEVSENG